MFKKGIERGSGVLPVVNKTRIKLWHGSAHMFIFYGKRYLEQVFHTECLDFNLANLSVQIATFSVKKISHTFLAKCVNTAAIFLFFKAV